MKSQEMYKKFNFITANGMTQFNNPQVANDVNPYECFDGGIDNDLGIEYSDASGRKRRGKPRKRRNILSSSRSRQDARRNEKTAFKEKELQAQKDMVANVSKSSEADATLLASLSNTNVPSVVGAKPPMSKTTKIVLISSGVVVLGIIAFVMYKKLKK